MTGNPTGALFEACSRALVAASRGLLVPEGWRFPPHWWEALEAAPGRTPCPPGSRDCSLLGLTVEATDGDAVLVCRAGDGGLRELRVVGCVGPPRCCDDCKREWPDDGSGPGALCPLCRVSERGWMGQIDAYAAEVARCWELLGLRPRRRR